MSEYQYYEFQTIDRALTAAQQDAIRSNVVRTHCDKGLAIAVAKSPLAGLRGPQAPEKKRFGAQPQGRCNRHVGLA